MQAFKNRQLGLCFFCIIGCFLGQKGFSQQPLPQVLQGFIVLNYPEGNRTEYEIIVRSRGEDSKQYRIAITPRQLKGEFHVQQDSVVWEGGLMRLASGFQIREPELKEKTPGFTWIPEFTWFDFERTEAMAGKRTWSVEWLQRMPADHRLNWVVRGRGLGLTENGEMDWAFDFLKKGSSFSLPGLQQPTRTFTGKFIHTACDRDKSAWNATLVYGQSGLNAGSKAVISFSREMVASRIIANPTKVVMLLDVISNKGDSLIELRPGDTRDIFFSGLFMPILNPRYRFFLNLRQQESAIGGSMRGPQTRGEFLLTEEKIPTDTLLITGLPGKKGPELVQIPVDTIETAKAEVLAPIDSKGDAALLRKLQQTQIDTLSTIRVTGETIELEWYDNAVVDGDSISIFVDNKLVIEKELLTVQPVKMTLQKKEGKPLLIKMLAENLGSIPPNTAVLIIRDGNNVQQFNMKSDLKNTGSILVYW